MNARDKVFVEAMPILNELEQSGYEAYFVGGAVRDNLLGKPVGDIDIATSATPEQVQALFEKVIPVGLEHGTVVVRYNHNSYEVTTFRVDGEYVDFRHPETVKFVTSIEEDLSRRDFTMNAIAMDKTGVLIDPFDGQLAIQRGEITTVGVAEERFEEDPLRMMRALRFVSQLSFTLDETTFNAVVKLKKLMQHISIERITVEFEKLFKGRDANKAWHLLIKSGLHKYLPIFKERDELVEACKDLHWRPLGDIAEAIAIFLLINPSVEVDHWVKQWKLSNKMKRKILSLLNAWTSYQTNNLKWTLYKLGEDHLAAFYRIVQIIDNESSLKLESMKEIHKHLPIQSRADLELDGNDIKSWFSSHRPGPWIQSFLTSVEELVVNGELNNQKDAIKERVLSWSPPEEN